ncbi:MAG: membrane dipeptidase [Candidatus Methanomethylicia archaeon]
MKVNPPLIDLHEDISYYYISGASGLEFGLDEFNIDMPNRHADIPKYRKANTVIVFSSIFNLLSTISRRVEEQLAKGYAMRMVRAWTPKAACLTAIEHIKVYYKLVERYSQDIMLLLSKNNINMVIGNGKIGFLLALEGSYILEDVDDLRIYYNLGIRSLQISWNFDSRYGASCMSTRDYGLTGEGEELVREANRMGVIVDLAHSSKNTQLDILSLSKLPVINSHSNTKKFKDVVRNLDEEVLDEIKRRRGVVGFMFGIIGGNEDIYSLADHIMYVYQTFGPDIIAIGTDYFGLIDMKAPKGLENIAKIIALYQILLDRGFKEADIEKLAYRNALRVIEENACNWNIHP